MKTKLWLFMAFILIMFSCSKHDGNVAEELQTIDYAHLKSNFQNPSNESGVN